MPSYMVVLSDEGDFSLVTLGEKVNELMQDGWTCVGGIALICNKDGVLLSAIQAMQKA